MYGLEKKLEIYLRVNLLWPGPRLMTEEFTVPRSYRGWETLICGMEVWIHSFLASDLDGSEWLVHAQATSHSQKIPFYPLKIVWVDLRTWLDVSGEDKYLFSQPAIEQSFRSCAVRTPVATPTELGRFWDNFWICVILLQSGVDIWPIRTQNNEWWKIFVDNFGSDDPGCRAD
jgi:hypothetical protein